MDILTAAGKHHILAPERNQVGGMADGMRAGGAGRGNAVVDAANTKTGCQ